MTVLPATLLDDATRSSTPLVNPECRALKQHQIVWYGLGLCCIHDYRNDRAQPPRSYTIPLSQLATTEAP